MMKKNSKKNFIWNTLGSLVNSFTSLFFMIIVTRINGTDIAGIFTFAFSMACLFQVIANYAGRVYQVTEISDDIGDSDFLFHKIATCVIMVLFVLVFILFKNYSLEKNVVILLLVLFRLIESFVEVIYAIIQKNNELYKVGISLFLKGIIGTILFFIVDYFTKSIINSIIALIVVNLVVSIFFDFRWVKPFYKKNSFNKDKVIKLFKGGFFVCCFTFLTQYILNAPKYAIDDLMSNDAQTVYGIISMVATILILCSQFIVQPLLVRIAEMIKDKKYSDLKHMTYKILIILVIIGCLGEIGCYLLGIPFLELVYGVPLMKYRLPLMLIVLGAMFFALSFIISTILTSLRSTFVQIVFYVITSVFIFFLSKYLVNLNGILGASISYAISMFLLFLMYFIYYIRKDDVNG